MASTSPGSAHAAAPHAAEPHAAEPRAAEPHAAEPHAAEPHAAEPHAAAPRAAEPHAAAPRAAAPRARIMALTDRYPLVSGAAGGLTVGLLAHLGGPIVGALACLVGGAAVLVFTRRLRQPPPDEAEPPPDTPLIEAELGDWPDTPLDAGPEAGPVRRTRTIRPESDVRPAMVAIEPGVFQMGSPADEVGRSGGEGQHEVVLTRGFWAAETPVTQGQYGALMGENPSWFSGSRGDEARPVEQVSWYDAVRYCNALSKAEGLPAAYRVGEGDAPEVEWVDDSTGYRLPTEAEWEYLARAGTATATWAGPLEIVGEHNAPALAEVGWYGGNSGSSHPRASDSSDWAEKAEPHTRASTQPVKGKGANPWGLYDVLGNVYEWVWDRHGAYPAGQAVDPAGPPRGGQRVFRGGAFSSVARGLRAAYRGWWHPGDRHAYLGLRPVRSAPRAGASVDRP